MINEVNSMPDRYEHSDKQPITRYSNLEERLNVVSHAIGFLLSLLALPLLTIHASLNGTIWHIVSFTIFGISLAVLYAASTIYHHSTSDAWRIKLNIVDHAAIYILIAGSYTPFTLVTLNGWVGWTVFGVIWGMALIGIVLKLFFTGRFDIISTAMYVLMGWMIVLVFEPLSENLVAGGWHWLLAGGIAYTVGAVIYSIRAIKLNHAIFHFFVLIGSSCHFVSVYFYVLP
jgi:hemolysin III